ncbi:amino acid permease [Tumebacillus permanentifrigoris]|uniref:Lysine:proton symporter (APA family) n=1 Tax=Tumebacillus permanentifrigoris TaxID=378543 RepID=A0A316D5U1_9BACL|nr:amino acid permease [Tumebacillus permanentifrigoris]PWK09040.1 lysine:proton symporter (APA family) [Tumebacillus permanentifrigoris]
MSKRTLGFWVLTALVVGNMVGSGIFMLPRSLAEVASPAGVLMAWLFTGLGVLMTALVFGNLSVRKPNLTGGPQVYAKALFKDGTEASTLSGYIVAWGYWVANFAGNVAIITTFASYLSTFFPILTSEAVLFTVGSLDVTVGHLLTFLVCSALLWGMHTLILRGIEGAGKFNLVTTITKVLGFTFFILVALFAFQKTNLLPMVVDRTTDGETVGLLGQVSDAAVKTLWAFVGVESAVVLSSRARKQSDVRKSTIVGLLIALVIYMGITVLVMGTLSQTALIQAEKPLVDSLSSVLGSSGSSIMALLGMISMLGTSVGWIMLSSEVPYQAAKAGLFPQVFLKENAKGAPSRALVITNLMSQLFIFSTISQSVSKAFDFVIVIATLAYLVPYVVASIYQLKLVITGEAYTNIEGKQRFFDGLVAALSTLYSLWVIQAGSGDMNTFLLGIGMLVVGLVFYPFLRTSKNRAPVDLSNRI